MQHLKSRHKLYIIALPLIIAYFPKRSTVFSISAIGTSKKTARLILSVNMNFTGASFCLRLIF
jgi:hypothetical protein